MLVLALAMTFAATGCKKHPTGVTKLPGYPPTRVGDGGPAVGNGGTLPPDGGIPEAVKGGGGIPIGATWTPDQMNPDPSKFAPFTVYFAFDSASVRSGERMKIESVAAALQNEPGLYLIIEGHCDERGTEEYNRSLGEKRALSLREELVKAGINPDRIRTLTFGEDKPAVSGHDEAAWGKNRRGVFIACTPK